VLGPPIAVLMVAAVVVGSRGGRETRFLIGVGLPFFLLTALTGFRAKVQPNWPAPAYFTLLILSAWFISTRLRDRLAWKPWRPWVYAAIVLGLVAMPVVHHTELLYPAVRAMRLKAGRVDPTARLKGWREQGQIVSRELASLGPGAIVVCEDYQTTAQMAFYVDDQPRTYCAGSYWTVSKRKRLTQYDMWPDRALDQPALLGRDAVYVGYMKPEIRDAFGRVEEPQQIEIVRSGVTVDVLRFARCYGFKGLTRPASEGPK
jgi:hypothetical protein